MAPHQLFSLILGLTNLILGLSFFAYGTYCLLYRMNSVIEKARREDKDRRGQGKGVQPGDDGVVKILAYTRVGAIIVCSLCMIFGGVLLLVLLPSMANWKINY